MAIAEVSGRKVYYEIHQEADAETDVPLILLTGTGGSCRGWLPLQVPAFSKTRKTIIFDHRGVMESQDPGGPFSTRDLANDTLGDYLAWFHVLHALQLGFEMIVV